MTPTLAPTEEPTLDPTEDPTTQEPTWYPTVATDAPSELPTLEPTFPEDYDTKVPTLEPTVSSCEVEDLLVRECSPMCTAWEACADTSDLQCDAVLACHTGLGQGLLALSSSDCTSSDTRAWCALQGQEAYSYHALDRYCYHVCTCVFAVAVRTAFCLLPVSMEWLPCTLAY